MKQVIFTIISMIFASTTFACVNDKDVIYEEVLRKNGYTYFVVSGSEAKVGSNFTVTTKIINTKTMRTPKKKNECTIEDLVVDCASSSYHVKNSTVYYNWNKIGYTKTGEQREIFEETLPAKLKDFYCGDKRPVFGSMKPVCTELVSKGPNARFYERQKLESQDKEVCK